MRLVVLVSYLSRPYYWSDCAKYELCWHSPASNPRGTSPTPITRKADGKPSLVADRLNGCPRRRSAAKASSSDCGKTRFRRGNLRMKRRNSNSPFSNRIKLGGNNESFSL